MAKLNSTVTVEQAQAKATADRQAQRNDVMLQSILDSMEKDRAAREAAMPSATPVLDSVKASGTPVNIKAFGADSSGAARTGLAVGAGVKQSAASYLNLAGAFTPGNLTIGEEVRAGNTEAERQKAMQEKKANTQEKVFSAADKLADSAQADIEKANEGASKFGKTLNSVATAGTQLIGDIAMNAIAPGSGLWAMGARTFGSSAQEARRNGATENQQFAYAAANTAVEVLTEKLFGGLISGEEGLIAKGLTKTKGGQALVNLLRNNGGTKLVQNVIDKVSQKTAGRIAVNAVKDFAGEGFEEFVSGIAQPLLDSIYNGKGIAENYSELDWQNVLEEVMVGGILGAIGGGTEGVVRPNNIGGTQTAQEAAPNAAAQRTNAAEGNLTAEAQSAATAQETASTAIGNAVSAVRDGGTVTNSVAERIISTDGALAQLGVDPNGKTASQLRGAVKDAIAQMAASEATTAQQTAQPMNEGIAAAGLMVNGQPGITPQNVESGNSLDTNQAVPYTENGTQNVFGGVMNGAENGAGISGNAERGIPGNKDMAAYSGDAGGYTGERGVGTAGQLLSTSRVIADNKGGTSAYSAWLNEARQSDQKNGWAVTPKEPSDLVGATMRVFGDGAAGYAVKDGDLEAVFKNKNKTNRRNLFEDILPQAIADGAVKGDCYGENLARLYAHSGAIPVARVEFNEAYANDGWTPDKGRPDIYMLMFSGDDADTVRAKQGTYHIPTVEELKALPFFDKESYDEAAAYRDRLLEQRRAAASLAQQAESTDTDTLAQMWFGNAQETTPQGVNAAPTMDNLGSARAGFETPDSRSQERTSNLASGSLKYNSARGEASALTKEAYDALFKYQSVTEEQSLNAAENVLYYNVPNEDGTTTRTFLADIDPDAYADVVKSLEDAPAWDGKMTDAAYLIEQELMARSQNMEIADDVYTAWLNTIREHETNTGRGIQAINKWTHGSREGGRGDGGNGGASRVDAWETLQGSDLKPEERLEIFGQICKYDSAIEAADNSGTLVDLIIDISNARGTLNAITGKAEQNA